MRKLFSIITIVISVFAFSQVPTKVVEDQFQHYSALIASKNFDTAISTYANDDFLKLVSKEQIIATLNQVFNSKEMIFKMFPPENIIISQDEIKLDKKTYVRLDYQQHIEMIFNGKDLPKEQILAALQREFGSTNVKSNSDNSYEINAHKSAVASSTDLQNWKFTVLEKDLLPLLSQFIPKQFLTNIQ